MNNKIESVLQQKRKGVPITIATAYDYPSARLVREAGIDVLLVGDSVGTNVLGYETEREVTMNDMLHHLRAVVRGASGGCIMVDLPYGAAVDEIQALENSRLLIDAGADIVKIEGWEDRGAIFKNLAVNGIAVCGHIGYNPQYHGPKGRIFGKEHQVAVELITSAQTLEAAGAVMLIVEKIPEEVTKLIATRVLMPVIGIGSGRYCDGQVLVFHDIVGLVWRSFRHARAWANLREAAAAGLSGYKDAVAAGSFPGSEHVSHISAAELAMVERTIGSISRNI